MSATGATIINLVLRRHERLPALRRVDAAWKIQTAEPTKRSVLIIQFAEATIAREPRT